MGEFRHHHSGKTRAMALFWLRTSYHAQRYMLQRYMLRSLLTQSFNIVNTPIILLFSKKWVTGFPAEDNKYSYCVPTTFELHSGANALDYARIIRGRFEVVQWHCCRFEIPTRI